MGDPRRYFTNSMPDHTEGENVTILESQWRSKILNTIESITKRQPAKVADADGGLYVGVGGIGFMFYYLSQSDVLTDRRDELLCRGLEYVTAAVKYVEGQQRVKDPSQKSALLLGDAGIYAVASVIYSALGDNHQAEQYLRMYADCAANCKPINFLSFGGDELFVGRAGYLFGLLWLQNIFRRPILPQQDIFDICNAIVQSGRNYSRQHRSPCPLMYAYYEVEYLGAAHGLCAILQALLSVPGFVNSNPDIERDVRASVDYLLSLQSRPGNFPCALDELGPRGRSDDDQLVHWCHGAPGVVYLMAKAYLVWKDEKYLKSCLKCGELVWIKGLLKKGPGICHGVAGSGYVFLLLFRLTGEQRHLHRAQAFAQYLDSDTFLHCARRPDCPYSLYEGLAGTCCFLADLTQPQRASFPLFDVF
ncbi:hypothetical protein B566_EDAN013145 [Ephemera danica]|nr:hypothetical protein B566_EDAN013145 [Ephemera danica]